MAAPAGPGNPRTPDAAILVAGPTASGKSVLAMELARRLRGTVINADAMQTYRDLRILTARPTAADEAQVPHALYGFRPAREPGSVADWRLAALEAMAAAHNAGRLPILCGGTGLYFEALAQGLAVIPDPGAAARAEARALLAEIGPAALHARLTAEDPRTAARLRPTDSQRLARAWEVWRGTGAGLASWQAGPALPPAPYRFFAILLAPARAQLRAAIAARFHTMLDAGALAEVRALAAQNLDPALPLMRAHGVPELLAHLRGDITLDAAAARAISATAAYTKRQATWFAHHALAPCSRTITSRMSASEQLPETILADMQHFIHLSVDARRAKP
jgi:tRNA dimethylallyltransferase